MNTEASPRIYNSDANVCCHTAAQLGPAGFTEAGTFIARPFPEVDGEFPLAHSTFFAPGAPITVRAGVRLTF